MRSPEPEAIPLLARTCVDRVKVLPGVEVYGDRRGDLEDAIRRVLHACFVERQELLNAMLRVRRRDPDLRWLAAGHEAWLRGVARELAGLPAAVNRSVEPRRTAGEAQGEGYSPLEVDLCVALVQSGEFGELAATATGLGDAFWSALSDYLPSPEEVAVARREDDCTMEWLLRGDPDALARMRLKLVNMSPGDGLLERSIRRFLEWFRAGGGDPPSSGPPGVPV